VVGFYGEYIHSVDDKGRVIMPSKIRYSLGERFHMTKGLNKSICVYTEQKYQEIADDLNRLPFLDPSVTILQRFLTSTETTVDSQGRVAIPAKLREYAGIKEQEEVAIVGAGSRVEIWNKKVWDRLNEDLDDDKIIQAAQAVGFALQATKNDG
jgi:MraZ protein